MHGWLLTFIIAIFILSVLNSWYIIYHRKLVMIDVEKKVSDAGNAIV